MTCRNLGGVIVCGPPPGVYHRRILFCPVCERRRRHVVRWEGAWYGESVYCACGDRWQDGELSPRPFERGWRRDAQERFRAMWANATTRDLYDAVKRADRGMYIGVRSRRQETKALRRYAVALERVRRSRLAS